MTSTKKSREEKEVPATNVEEMVEKVGMVNKMESVAVVPIRSPLDEESAPPFIVSPFTFRQLVIVSSRRR